jgi:hypothetical protein
MGPRSAWRCSTSGKTPRASLYALGNINGTPFGSNGRVLRLAPLP